MGILPRRLNSGNWKINELPTASTSKTQLNNNLSFAVAIGTRIVGLYQLMTDVVIREATVADADALAAVYRSAYSENQRLGFPTKAASATAETVVEWLRDGELFVAHVHEEIVGGVRLEQTDEDRVKLSRLAVHDAWKGNGIGSELLDYAEMTVREWGCSTIWLSTPEEHPYLPDIYRDRGYEKTAPYPLEYRDYDEIVMEKQLHH